MRTKARAICGLVLGAFALVGCAVYPGSARPASIEDLRGEEGWILLDSVPFVRQVSEKGCGAACLSMVLGHWGSEAAVESLEAECAIDGQVGIRASALRDAARRRGLSAFLFGGSMEDLEHELSRGRPVVVGLVKPAGDGFTTHFQVVTGLHPGRRRIAVLDPAVGLMSDSIEAFEGEWRPAKGVTLVVFLPATRPEPTSVVDARGGGGR